MFTLHCVFFLFRFLRLHFFSTTTMGNWLSGCNDNNTGEGSDIEQPKIFGDLPPPYPIERINPALLFYPSKGKEFVVSIDASLTPSEAVALLLDKGCLLNGSRRLAVITHGFRSNKDAGWLHQVKDAILAVDSDPHDVAILGWGEGATVSFLKYAQAAANALETGRWLGQMMAEVKARCPQLQIYGIGHSLGAHLMGVAGRSSNKAFDRITGLDPAGVGFQDTNIDKRLNRLDATLVDVIHTDGKDVPYFGTLVPLGTIDFYPNYGWNQPTHDQRMGAKPDIDLDEKTKRKRVQQSEYGGYISESHGRAIDYFRWSINHKGAFRTVLHLDGVPDIEKPVHRIYATPEPAGVEVEMGYYCDRHLQRQVELAKCVAKVMLTSDGEGQQQEEDEDEAEKHAKVVEERRNARQDDYSRYEKFHGNYYVHTNAQDPWC